MTVVALIVVPGSVDVAGPATGEGASVWADVDHRPLFTHGVTRLQDAGVERVVLVVEPADADRARALFPAGAVTVTTGVGTSTALSAIEAAAVLVHDPHRALAPVAVIRRVLDALRSGAVAVVPVLPVVDTIRSVDAGGRASHVVDREALRIVQTPQGFDLAVLRRAHAGADHADHSDHAATVVAAGFDLTTVAGHADAARLVTAADLDHARRVLEGTIPTGDAAESPHG